MISFQEHGVKDDDIFYVALHARLGDEGVGGMLPAALASIPYLADSLKCFRVAVILFDNRVEDIRFYHEKNIRDVLDYPLDTKRWVEGVSFDRVAGFVIGNHTEYLARPKLFVYTDCSIITNWNLGTLSQMVDIVWMYDKGLDIGIVDEFDLRDVLRKAKIDVEYANKVVGILSS